jgi:hypothetical protein
VQEVSNIRGHPLMNITSDFFSFNVWEWFLHFSILERTKSDSSKINKLHDVILLHSNSVGWLYCLVRAFEWLCLSCPLGLLVRSYWIIWSFFKYGLLCAWIS